MIWPKILSKNFFLQNYKLVQKLTVPPCCFKSTQLNFSKEAFAKENFIKKTLSRKTLSRKSLSRKTLAGKSLSRKTLARKTLGRKIWRKPPPLSSLDFYVWSVVMLLQKEICLFFRFQKVRIPASQSNRIHSLWKTSTELDLFVSLFCLQFII